MQKKDEDEDHAAVPGGPEVQDKDLAGHFGLSIVEPLEMVQGGGFLAPGVAIAVQTLVLPLRPRWIHALLAL